MLLLSMARREDPNQIPKKFRKLGKSFLEHLPEKDSSSLSVFPKGLTFYGKEKDESVVLVVRSHWIIYVPFVLVSLIIMVLPLFLGLLSSEFFTNTSLFLALSLSCFTISLSIIVYSFTRWFYNVNIVTNKRIVDLDFTSVVSHSLAEARLRKIEDISHKQIGIIGSVFDVGTIYFQTAGATPEIEFDNIPRPRDIQDVIYDLLDSKKKGDI